MEYNPNLFTPKDLNHAKDIVITPDPNDPLKFENFTNEAIRLITNANIINETSCVVDFGCGMGRMSKAIVDNFNCEVVGIDINLSMLKLATMYVANHTKFVTCNNVGNDNVIDVCLAMFVIQHVLDPTQEIKKIADILKPNGYFVLLNESKLRLVPGGLAEDNSIVWFTDGFDIYPEVEKYFNKVMSVPFLNTDYDFIIYKKKPI
jgi:ubiquinone/menaquinone biosynthesis C-methylase UbiE